MKRICLISHGQPSADPRMVRSADALAAAGFQVSVMTPRFNAKWAPADRRLVERARWRYRFVDFLEGKGARLRWQWVRLRVHGARFLSQGILSEAILSRACNYANPELAALAAGERADLYIAHQHHALPAAACAARRTGARLAFDAEDLLADCSSEPRWIHRRLEELYLKRCAYVSTMSPSAARWLQDRHRLARPPIVLRNVPPLAERGGVLEPRRRSPTAMPSLYWMGQTIGPHSCAENVLLAMHRLSRPVRLVLQGFPDPAYVEGIQRLAAELQLGDRLEIRAVVPPDQLVHEASRHDIGLGTQPAHEPFHELALGNKAFFGMMAGLALLLSDTTAYRELLSEAPGGGSTWPTDQMERMAERLDEMLREPDRLTAMKQRSWEWAESRYHWEKESEKLIAAVEKSFEEPRC